MERVKRDGSINFMNKWMKFKGDRDKVIKRYVLAVK